MRKEEINRPEVAEASLQGTDGMIPFQLFKTDVCFQVSNDIFAGLTYPNVPFVTRVKTVLDIGANVGAASVYLSMSYPDARVYALEPGNDALSLLRKNVAPLRNVTVFPFGLYSRDTTISLFRGKNDSVESSVHASTRTEDEGEQVNLVDAARFLFENGIEKVDVLKIDTEGCEVPILQSLSKWLPDVKVLYLEYHSERDRRMIDGMLAKTHILWRGQIKFAYRGEFCYLRRDLVPDESEIHTCEILLNLD
jgi:FkbM family methyltransferase